MIKQASAAILVCAFCFSAALLAQAPPMPKPAPELKKLDYFVGTWKLEGDMKPSPMGPGGKFTGAEHNQWMEGGFFLVGHSDFNGAGMGTGKGLAIMGFDSDRKMYTYQEYSSLGEADASLGSVDGDTWTWSNEQKMGGQIMKGRFSIKQLSATSYAFKFEMAPPGGDMVTVMEGKATKQ